MRRQALRPQSLTTYSKFSSLRYDRHGSLIVRLMMAANDISLANWTIVQFQGEVPRMRRHMQAGAVQYFVRLMCGHLFEALDLIRAVRKEPELAQFVSRCSAEARAAYQGLCNCLPNGKDHAYFKNYVARMRQNIAFHYDDRHVKRALQDIVSQRTQTPAKLTLGMDYYLTRFNLADVVMDSIAVRQIMRIPPDGDVRLQAKRFEEFVNEKCISFLRFVNEFATNYIRKYAMGR